ncbi:MAG: radical SAM protein [Roseburia sp.]
MKSDLQILLKPVSAACDLGCRYCFYKDEEKERSKSLCGRMTEKTMESVISKALSDADSCTFGFQGGEPTLAGLHFFRRFTELVDEYKKTGQQIFYTLQTNGMYLKKDWLSFLKEQKFVVGLSLDGVRKTHDENRRDSQGNGTFSVAFESAKRLREEGILVQVLCVLNAQTAAHIQAIYRFFIQKELFGQQYIPCLDPLKEKRGSQVYSLLPGQYEVAMKQLFDLWFEDRRRGIPVRIRQFDNYVAMLRGGHPEACSMYGKCSMQNVIESDGSVYPCDFYALDEYYMGNINDESVSFHSLWERAEGTKKHLFFWDAKKRDDRCPNCRWYPLCRGGCRRDCDFSAYGNKNYYCQSYSEFFRYAIGRLEYLASLPY